MAPPAARRSSPEKHLRVRRSALPRAPSAAAVTLPTRGRSDDRDHSQNGIHAGAAPHQARKRARRSTRPVTRHTKHGSRMGVDKVDPGTGDAGDRVVVSGFCTGCVLGNEALDHLTGSRAVKQDGSHELPISHFRTPTRMIVPRLPSPTACLQCASGQAVSVSSDGWPPLSLLM